MGRSGSFCRGACTSSTAVFASLVTCWETPRCVCLHFRSFARVSSQHSYAAVHLFRWSHHCATIAWFCIACMHLLTHTCDSYFLSLLQLLLASSATVLYSQILLAGTQTEQRRSFTVCPSSCVLWHSMLPPSLVQVYTCYVCVMELRASSERVGLGVDSLW